MSLVLFHAELLISSKCYALMITHLKYCLCECHSDSKTTIYYAIRNTFNACAHAVPFKESEMDLEACL